MDDYFWMTRALLIARRALFLNEVPVGTILVLDNFEISCAINSCYITSLHHSEINLICRSNSFFPKYFLCMSTMYVTLEPCFVCKTLLSFYKIKKVVFGVYCGNILYNDFIRNFKMSGGIFFDESYFVIKNFFINKR